MINNLIQIFFIKTWWFSSSRNSLESSHSKVHPIFKKLVDLNNVSSVVNVITISSTGIIF